jgi:hypothetical protein
MDKEARMFERWLQLYSAEREYKEARLREPLSKEQLDAEFSKLLEQEAQS